MALIIFQLWVTLCSWFSHKSRLCFRGSLGLTTCRSTTSLRGRGAESWSRLCHPPESAFFCCLLAGSQSPESPLWAGTPQGQQRFPLVCGLVLQVAAWAPVLNFSPALLMSAYAWEMTSVSCWTPGWQQQSTVTLRCAKGERKAPLSPRNYCGTQPPLIRCHPLGFLSLIISLPLASGHSTSHMLRDTCAVTVMPAMECTCIPRTLRTCPASWRSFESESVRCSVVSNFVWPHGLQPTRGLCSWILQTRILERVAIPLSRGSSRPRD